MDILIIGGSRFVGPLLVENLLKKKHNITLFNRGHVRSNYTAINFIQGDRNNGFPLNKHFDIVIDMCAYAGSQTKAAIQQIDFDFFIHFSSAAAYKKTNTFPLTEESELGVWPLWGEYNLGKVECENVLQESGIKFASIRPVYILGPNNYCDREHFIYSRIKSNVPITLPGDGQALVQFVFAKEVANSLSLLAEEKVQGAFNCVGDDRISLQNLVEEMGKIVGKKPMLSFNPSADGKNFNQDEFPFANETFLCSNKKLKSLGIKFTPLLKGLEEDYKKYYSKLD
ncbi:GDP-L-fucose synthase [Candidatus Bilamarchaeum dharawalense]|uniref:GDP-L-fucose synthase n=1 Tax=Candidatus Bilamarchaeum dharawalense TaxID=2885759 RepID=A0A5E4LNF8_9ARCH|nr:GDP-L-fucose synthase [Candidatus Bilamarchaeum dharawalense]